jgi:3-oxoacyl-[acyl-carrier protein] reductase
MTADARKITPDDVRHEIESDIPLRMIPPQDDIANSVLFFASPWSRVITGQTLDVNGGEYLG